jgi:hypothetical protein
MEMRIQLGVILVLLLVSLCQFLLKCCLVCVSILNEKLITKIGVLT